MMVNTMTSKEKGILINGIIIVLNEQLIKKNKQLCSENRHCDQIPLHGVDMFLCLAFKTDDEITNIAKHCGL